MPLLPLLRFRPTPPVAGLALLAGAALLAACDGSAIPAERPLTGVVRPPLTGTPATGTSLTYRFYYFNGRRDTTVTATTVLAARHSPSFGRRAEPLRLLPLFATFTAPRYDFCGEDVWETLPGGGVQTWQAVPRYDSTSYQTGLPRDSTFVLRFRLLPFAAADTAYGYSVPLGDSVRFVSVRARPEALPFGTSTIATKRYAFTSVNPTNPAAPTFVTVIWWAPGPGEVRRSVETRVCRKDLTAWTPATR